MLRNWLRGAFRSGLAGVGLAVVVVSPAFGQVATGKIQGRVTDAATGAPIAGAQVVVDGTTLGNLTNDQGFYFINEVPAGLQNVRSQFIGYRSFVIEGQRILAGQTTTLNFELEQTAVELEAITVEGERNPLVPRDQTSTKSIVQGVTVDQAPVDNASDVVVLQPGVVSTNRGRVIRGGRPNEEAVFVDGVLVRSFGQGTADNLALPTNGLEQVDVTVGSFAAEFGEAQSGVVSFVTRSGGPQFTGSLEFQTDQVTSSWRTNFNRAELTLGGPIAGPLTFFIAGTAQGQDANRTQNYPERWVIDGIETCPSAGSGGADYSSLCDAGDPAIIAVERGSNTPGALDVVDIAAPNFVPWDNARTFPKNWTQQDLFTGNLNYQLPRGSRINFSYNRNRFQNYGTGGFDFQFNPDDVDAGLTTSNVFTLGAFITLKQTADQQIALDLRGSYQSDRTTNGIIDQQWWLDNQDPFLGFNFGNVKFLLPDEQNVTGFDAFDVTEDYLNAYRSNAIPRDSMLAFPQRIDLRNSQSLTGLDKNLRYNPYGTRIDFSINNPGNGGLQKIQEDRWQFRGSLDWQIGRFNRLKTGVEYISIDLMANNVPLFEGVPLPEAAKPKRLGAFLQDRLDIGDLVIEGGIRYDYLDPDTELPRVPGHVFNVPEEWQKGFVRYDSNTGQYVPRYDEECNGAETCEYNFVETQTKSEWSPRIGASFPVTPTSTFRLSYGRFVQTPAFFTTGSFATGEAGVAQAQIGFLQDGNTDLTNTNTNASFARDVNMPSTRQFEFGYRQLIGQDLVVDVSAFNKKQREALTTRKLPFTDPVNGQTVFMNVVTNKDFTESNGFEVRADKAIGNLFVGNLSYTFVDARGTSSDPFNYENLVQRAVTNLAVITGLPPNPAEVLLPLDQSRKHNIALTTSLAFPLDYMQGSTIGAILSDFGIFALLRVQSGLPVTTLVNSGNGQIGPPSLAGLDAQLQTSINNTVTPWTYSFDLRFTKGFQFGNWNLQAFVDWRNPFNLTQQNQVFLETGNEFNDEFETKYLSDRLTDTNLDGDNAIRDFDIIAESPDNDFNKYMLLRAEERYGIDDPLTAENEKGDGIFTVEEQRAAFLQRYDVLGGSNVVFKTSDQQLRLGLRVAF